MVNNQDKSRKFSDFIRLYPPTAAVHICTIAPLVAEMNICMEVVEVVVVVVVGAKF